MESYKRSSHTVWDCKYRLIWTAYWYQVLGGEVGRTLRGVAVRDSVEQGDASLYGTINWDHVHMLIRMPPYLSASRLVQYLKGKISQKFVAVGYPGIGFLEYKIPTMARVFGSPGCPEHNFILGKRRTPR
ncbi:MAG: transposase [Gammaproteobacteria bacterium]